MPEQRHQVFAHLTADRATTYRSILEAFVQAKERFALHLRPADVERAMAGAEVDAAGSVGAALVQLVAWGNLEAHPDTADVATVEEFYRPRHLYQLTPEGQAAERSIELFERTLRERAELQAVALADIRVLLAELIEVAGGEPLDEGKAHRALLGLRGRFEELTAKAQAFMGTLQRTIDLHGLSVEGLLLYKQSLIDYLERFIGDLVLATAEIGTLLEQLEERGIAALLAAAARRELADALERTDDDVRAAQAAWSERWAGLRAWFLARAGEPSQAEVLRQRARAAIPALLAAVASCNDRRVARSDRSADLRALAVWFAEAESDADAHRLWRAAFALAPARHLFVDDDTLAARETEPVPSQVSWLDAPPMGISPRMRESGRYTRPGPASRVVDRSEEKAALARTLAEETAQIEAARLRLASGRPTRLSALGWLGRAEFGLLLDLLGEAVARRVRPDDVVDAASGDGSLVIRLEPPPDGAEAILDTEGGRMWTPDFLVTITDAFSDALAAGVPADPASVP